MCCILCDYISSSAVCAHYFGHGLMRPLLPHASSHGAGRTKAWQAWHGTLPREASTSSFASEMLS